MSYDYRPSSFKLLPDVVKNLLIINIIFFAATFIFEKRFGIDLTDKLGLHYFGSDKFKPYQLITYMFMHGSLAHIFFNMFALYMFGSSIENFWGGKRFLIFYIITGLGAALTHYAVVYFVDVHPMTVMINEYIASPGADKLLDFTNDKTFTSTLGAPEMQELYGNFSRKYNSMLETDPRGAIQASIDFMTEYRDIYMNLPVVVGASGAIFGLLLAFGMMFPNNMIYIYFAIPLKAKYFVILYGALELFSGISGSRTDNVAHFAHLGGMLFGFILILYWRKNGRYS
jgi:membrane associated rhomboid family serine protease